MKEETNKATRRTTRQPRRKARAEEALHMTIVVLKERMIAVPAVTTAGY